MNYIFYWYNQQSEPVKTLVCLIIAVVGILGLAYAKNQGWI